ncbi:MAG: hypothetical protein KJ621_07150 [Proteobacteria bacterium]|nr:hypothetical protein [Pseudomonadota bacterium]
MEIVVFGPGYGESVLLHIPGVGWGVIDSCIVKDGQKKVVPALEYLAELYGDNPPELAFIILTHPHEDHYAGMDKMITEHPGGVRLICRYNGLGLPELCKLLVAENMSNRIESSPGLLRVFRAMDEAANKDNVAERYLAEMTEVISSSEIQLPGFTDVTVRMVALCPSSRSMTDWFAQITSLFPARGEIQKSISPRLHNQISAALYLQFGQVHVVFGGDVEIGNDSRTGWQGVMNAPGRPDLEANYVKVAHHGSVTGFYPPAWQEHAKNSKPIGVITPWSLASNSLPTGEDLKRLATWCDPLYITRRSKANNVGPSQSRGKAKKRISWDVRSWHDAPEPELPLNFLRVRFLPNGEVTEITSPSPTLRISRGMTAATPNNSG